MLSSSLVALVDSGTIQLAPHSKIVAKQNIYFMRQECCDSKSIAKACALGCKKFKLILVILINKGFLSCSLVRANT